MLESDPEARTRIGQEIIATANALRSELRQFRLDPGFPIAISQNDLAAGMVGTILRRLGELKYVTGVRFEKGIEKKVIAEYVKRGTRFTPRWIHWDRRTVVRFINERVGFGLFATSEFDAGGIVCEYAGFVCRYESIQERTYSYTYVFQEPNDLDLTLVVDSLREGNESRFINHSRESNLLSSCEFYNGHSHVLLRARRTIRQGEQLFLDYGESYWSAAGRDPEDLA
jgi:hypothetical protein